MGFIDVIKEKARADKKTIVLPESMDRRTWVAAEKILKEDLANLVIIGTPEDIGEPVDFSSIDVSFISLTKVLGPVKEILSPGGEVVALIKPQFEAGREKVGKKGVVREKSTHLEVIQMVMAYAAEIGFEIRNLEFSPIKGPEGNIEYLLYLHKPEQASEETVTGEEALAKAEKECPVSPEQVVEEAHMELDKT